MLRLEREVLVTDPGTIAMLVADLDALRPIHGAFSCPTSDGSQVLALIAYPMAIGSRFRSPPGAAGSLRTGISCARSPTSAHKPGWPAALATAEAARGRERPPPEALSSSSYRALFRLPGVRPQAVAGLLAQISQGAISVGIILLVHEKTGSLALAGGVVAALWIAAGVSRPIQGRLIDRRGPAAVMAVCGSFTRAAVAGIVGLAALHAPGSLLVAAGALTGLTLPPVSAAMRVAWAEIAEPGERAAAYSLVYLVQEVAILAGPLILAGLIAAVSVSLALLVIAAVTAAGSLGFAASEPPPAGTRSPRPATAEQALLRIRTMQVLLMVAVLIGAMLGGIQIGAPTFATARDAPAAAGLLIARCRSAGSSAPRSTEAAGGERHRRRVCCCYSRG